MTRTKKPPTLAQLRRLAKMKGLLSWPSIRLDAHAGGAWHESWARVQVFRFGESPDEWKRVAKAVIFAALSVLPDAPKKASRR